MKNSSIKNVFYIVIVTLSLSISSYHFQKSLKLAGLISYTVLLGALITFLFKYSQIIITKIRKINPSILFFLLLVVLFIGFMFWYPFESKRSIATDRDEALNQSVQALLNLEYPYYEKTIVTGRAHQLGLDGNPITILPGSIIFAIPFVLLGNSAYQSFFWLFLFYVFLTRLFFNKELAVLFIILIIFGSPTFLFQIFIGSDYIANSIWILILVGAFINSIKMKKLKYAYIYSFILGIGIASRFNFILLFIPISFYLFKLKLEPKIKMVIALTMLFAFIFIVFPFWIYDPTNFTPLYYSNLFSSFKETFMFAEYIFPFITMLIALFLSLFNKLNEESMLWICGIILLFPVLGLFFLGYLKTRTLDFSLSHYACPFSLFLGLFAFKKLLSQKIYSENPLLPLMRSNENS